jgi:hypothetical protein
VVPFQGQRTCLEEDLDKELVSRRAEHGDGIVAYLDPAAVPCLGHATHPDRLGRMEERHKEALDGRLSVLANNNASRGCKGRKRKAVPTSVRVVRHGGGWCFGG